MVVGGGGHADAEAFPVFPGVHAARAHHLLGRARDDLPGPVFEDVFAGGLPAAAWGARECLLPAAPADESDGVVGTPVVCRGGVRRLGGWFAFHQSSGMNLTGHSG